MPFAMGICVLLYPIAYSGSGGMTVLSLGLARLQALSGPYLAMRKAQASLLGDERPHIAEPCNQVIQAKAMPD